MRSLEQIINVLRPSEMALIKVYLSRQTNDEPKLRLELLQIAASKPGITDNEAKLLLKEDISSSAFSHLKERLRRDMLNAILWQESSKRFPESYMAASFECSKNMAQGYLLLMRGATDEALRLLRRAEKLANDHELIGERVMLNQLIRRNLRSVRSAAQLKKLNDEIRKDLENLGTLNQTEELSIAIAAPHLFKGSSSNSIVEVGEPMIKELQNAYANSGLSRVGFWYLMTATEFHSSRNEHSIALEYGTEFLNVVKQNKAVHSKPNLAGVSLTVGFSHLMLRQFEKAIEHFETASTLFRSGGINQLNSLEHLMKAQVAHPSLSRARVTVEAALQHPILQRNSLRLSTWTYYSACVKLLSADPSAAMSALNSTVDVTKGKDEHSVQFRILEIMTMIELDDLDWIEFKYDTLRKFLARNRKLSTPRVKATLAIISSLMRKGFDLSKISKSAKAELHNMINESETYEWQPDGAELVRFDDWVQRKLG